MLTLLSILVTSTGTNPKAIISPAMITFLRPVAASCCCRSVPANAFGRAFSTTASLPCGATSVAIANAYYPDNRTTSQAVSKLCIQLGIDAVGNVLKEFWPDLYRKMSRKKHRETGADRMPAH